MKCMHCLVEYYDKEEFIRIGKDADKEWAISKRMCPSCERMNLFLMNFETATQLKYTTSYDGMISSIPIRPRGSSRPPCPAEVTTTLAADYAEACLVLPDSPKASAALSRRCLQNLLREAAKVKPGNLDNEIQEVINSGKLPSHLAEAIDSIRQIGNFAAHPTKSQSTGEIVPVEPEEASWNLDVLESLFDFYYVRPQILAMKKADLNTKLKDAGKPPMK